MERPGYFLLNAVAVILRGMLVGRRTLHIEVTQKGLPNFGSWLGNFGVGLRGSPAVFEESTQVG